MKECLRRGDCLSVNYWRSQLRCQLNPAVVGPGLALIPDSSGVYMEKSSQPQDLSTGPCSTISCAQTCTDLSNGGRTFCGPTVKPSVDCPAGFLWRPAASLCYKATDISMTWSEADAYCVSIGARLAKLDTDAKINIVDSDYNGGALVTHQYYIGGSVVSGATSEWQWVGGTPMDPAFQTLYSLTLTDGQCLLWDFTTRLSQYACTFAFPALCEVPVTPVPQTTTTIPTTTTTTTQPLATTCPSHFRWSATNNLCYFVEEINFTWQDAKTNCESMGARLAILDTAAKLDLIFSDYMSALLLYWRYFIGGYFDDVIYDWKWINGSVIDPNHLMNYPVAGIPGVCLLWTDIDYLYDYPCDMIFPSICEIPIKGCPSNFRWDASLNMCYFVEETHMIWQDAKTNCESIGARLAILDTVAKLDLIFNDYMASTLLYFDYFIGGIFNDSVMDWKWINGSFIEPSYLMNYPVGGGTGMCLLWSDIYYIDEYPCDITFPSICEIPFPSPP
uniref:C-type mannose receptor 2-like n=1 Tax=Crassostrea virginica TaxID=6565 RepID=A0A8B8A5C3_CRAVI|nr:C-type mannose receptor 2-like [Crassostrea virginica]